MRRKGVGSRGVIRKAMRRSKKQWKALIGEAIERLPQDVSTWVDDCVRVYISDLTDWELSKKHKRYLDDDELVGLAGVEEDGNPCVGLNCRILNDDEEVFLYFYHEVAHVWLKYKGVASGERAANRQAKEWLVQSLLCR